MNRPQPRGTGCVNCARPNQWGGVVRSSAGRPYPGSSQLLDFDEAVNVTLGLPKPRTSPSHGNAFSFAGKGEANPASMTAAIRLACGLV